MALQRDQGCQGARELGEWKGPGDTIFSWENMTFVKGTYDSILTLNVAHQTM